jgi:SAM-dependent methyltransferase
MPRPGEFTFYEQIGAENREDALNKPFSDPRRGELLMEVGAVSLLLPPPPCRVLECGCGPGWLTYFLAKSGYDVVGQDVNSQAIELANTRSLFRTTPHKPDFVICDYERLPFTNEFDSVVFFDSLHHAIDLDGAIAGALGALKTGGRLIASEPGVGHTAASREVVEQYDVTDRDTPPFLTLRLGLKAGFSKGYIYPHAALIGRSLYRRQTSRLGGIEALARAAAHTTLARRNGIIMLVK